MFDELIRLKAGDTAAYQKARDMAWRWVLQNPLNRESKAWDRWSGFFEDIPYRPDNVNQFLPDMTAYYIMTRRDPASVDPEWVSHVGHLIDSVRLRFGRGPFMGAWAIDEQGTPSSGFVGCCSRAGQGSHGGRWAAINAMYAELTGDGQAREDAFRSMNYATYFTSSEGLVACCGTDYHAPFWFSDILRSSSVVQKVNYAPNRVSYTTFDKESTEVLRLNFKPARITAGGLAFEVHKDTAQAGYTVEQTGHGDFIVRIRHENSPQVVIEGQ
jgi:hypothetical protein